MNAKSLKSEAVLPLTLHKVKDRVLYDLRVHDDYHEMLAEVVEMDESNRRAYIHFVELDKRNDIWVSSADLRPAPIQEPTTHIYPTRLTRAAARRLKETRPMSEKVTGNAVVQHEERLREERTRVKNITKIVFGLYSIDAWYYSPFADATRGCTVFMCDRCLKYGYCGLTYHSHIRRCQWKRPPGTCIYQDTKRSVRVYEVDGLVNTVFCQCLCLLGKLFIDHKTLFFDVAPFLFYVVTLNGEIAGFFSKEKREMESPYNLACIVTLPQHQRKGIGRFLIALSYTLCKVENIIGTVERPLSDLAQISYRNYWNFEVLSCVQRLQGDRFRTVVLVSDIVSETMIKREDVDEVLKRHNLLLFKGHCVKLESKSLVDEALKRAKLPKLPIIPIYLDYMPRSPKATATPKTKKRIRRSNGIQSRPKNKSNRDVSVTNILSQGPSESASTTNTTSLHSRSGTSKSIPVRVSAENFENSTERIWIHVPNGHESQKHPQLQAEKPKVTFCTSAAQDHDVDKIEQQQQQSERRVRRSILHLT